MIRKKPAGVILVLAVQATLGATALASPQYQVYWPNDLPPFRVALWTQDATRVQALGAWCEQALSNTLYRNGFGGLELMGGIQYGDTLHALRGGQDDVIETDPATYLLYLQEHPAADGPPPYLPALQVWQTVDDSHQPVVVCAPGLDPQRRQDWLGARLALVDSYSSIGGLAQLEWLESLGLSPARDLRLVICGSPGDALTRLRTGLVDAAAVPLGALRHTDPGDDVLVLELENTLLPRMFVIRSDLAVEWPGLSQDVVETFRDGLGVATAIPAKLEFYEAERERWNALVRRIFGPRGR